MPEQEPTTAPILRAIKLRDYGHNSWKDFFAIVDKRKAGWTVHHETDSILLDEQTASIVAEVLASDDVTEEYRQLQARRDGYQVLRIGNGIKLEDGTKIRGSERIIKNYQTGTYLMIGSFGEEIPLTEPWMVMDRLCSGSFDTPAEADFSTIFETLEEAKEAFY